MAPRGGAVEFQDERRAARPFRGRAFRRARRAAAGAGRTESVQVWARDRRGPAVSAGARLAPDGRGRSPPPEASAERPGHGPPELPAPEARAEAPLGSPGALGARQAWHGALRDAGRRQPAVESVCPLMAGGWEPRDESPGPSGVRSPARPRRRWEMVPWGVRA